MIFIEERRLHLEPSKWISFKQTIRSGEGLGTIMPNMANCKCNDDAKYGHLFLHPQNPPSESQNPCISPNLSPYRYFGKSAPWQIFRCASLTYQKDGDRDHLPPQIEAVCNLWCLWCWTWTLATPGQDDSRILDWFESSCFFCCIKILGSWFHEVML